jgi:hypothetical protein
MQDGEHSQRGDDRAEAPDLQREGAQLDRRRIAEHREKKPGPARERGDPQDEDDRRRFHEGSPRRGRDSSEFPGRRTSCGVQGRHRTTHGFGSAIDKRLS